jgi:peroxiredoxin
MKKTFLFSIAITGLIFLSSMAFKTQAYEVGAVAADFKLKNIDGSMFALSEKKDIKGAIVIFTCNHCPFAKAYEDRIISLDKKYASLGYPVIAINPNDSVAYPEDSYSAMIKRAKDKKFTFPYLLDDSQETAKTYGATKTPHVYLLHKENDQMVVKYIGAIDDNSDNAKKVKEKYLENALTEVIAGKEVTVKSTKAIGCGIKWKK